MRFYERMEPISAKLVLLSNDFVYIAEHLQELSAEEAAQAFKKSVLQYGEILKTLKSEALAHQFYIPSSVFLQSHRL